MNKPTKVLLTVYHRVGCHLCEQMTASLRLLQNELDFEFEQIDIDRDEQLRKRYDVDVPVVTRGSEVVCYHFFEEDMVRQAIENT
ncbi:MAG: thioredoxin family protein [Thiothrix nivea]|nr:MAG: thioredoxin family protein [Thiothrix nivea]